MKQRGIMGVVASTTIADENLPDATQVQIHVKDWDNILKFYSRNAVNGNRYNRDS